MNEKRKKALIYSAVAIGAGMIALTSTVMIIQYRTTRNLMAVEALTIESVGVLTDLVADITENN